MAKILVADDNSNVQKTVALALADLGVEVVSVNNGEAAVRKLGDVSPDLVLADIFMPVRNGYEVCEYVKKDARFSHLPVVLLVGAFDPLDEREAQRVGADGILKKPFVPPDPLITMVRMLLERTLGERLVTVGAAEPAVAARGKSGGIATADEPQVKTAAVSKSAQVPEPADEFPEQELQPAPDRLTFGDGERPIAFESLLGTMPAEPATAAAGLIEPVEDEQILTGSRDASLGDPIFWKTEEPAPEEASEEDPAAEQDLTAEPPLRAWKPDTEAAARPLGDEVLQPVEPFELVREDNDPDSDAASTIVETSEVISQDAASQAPLNVNAAKPDDLAANPLEWMATAPKLPVEEVPEASEAVSGADSHQEFNSQELEVSPPVDTPEPELAESPADLAPSASAEPLTIAMPSMSATPEAQAVPEVAEVSETQKTQPALAPVAASTEETAHSIHKQDWADLAAGLESDRPENQGENAEPAPVVAAVPDEQLEGVETGTAKPVSQSAVDTARAIPRSEWASLTARLESKRDETTETASGPSATENSAATAGSANTSGSAATSGEANLEGLAAGAQALLASSASPAGPDPELVEAVVQRILDKMRPQVVDIITKEFLRPIVQALVTREITKR